MLFRSSARQEKEEKAQKIYCLALESYAKQDFIRTIELADKAISCDKNLYHAQLLKIKSLYFANQNEKAEKTAAKLVKNKREFTEARIWQIRILLQNNELKKAHECLEHELSLNTTDWRVFYLYALLAEKQGNFDVRLSMEKQAETVIQESGKVFIDLASIWLSLGLRERALDYLEKAKSISANKESMESVIRRIKNGDDIL